MPKHSFTPPRVYAAKRGISIATVYERKRKGLLPKFIYDGKRSLMVDAEIDVLDELKIASASDDELRDAVRQLMAARKNFDPAKVEARSERARAIRKSGRLRPMREKSSGP